MFEGNPHPHNQFIAEQQAPPDDMQIDDIEDQADADEEDEHEQWHEWNPAVFAANDHNAVPKHPEVP
jgi:hypothetical protein